MVRHFDGAHWCHRRIPSRNVSSLIFPTPCMQTTVSIPGIHCASCAALIKDVSGEFPAIKSISVDSVTKNVTLDHDESFEMKKWTEEIEALDEKYKVQSVS